MLIDFEWARKNLPKRQDNSNKGSFGKLFAVIGSERYRGAARLALEASLRGGAGYVYLACSEALCREFSATYPEVIYKSIGCKDAFNEQTIEMISAEESCATATLIGCGVGVSLGLYELCRKLLCTVGSTLVIDADAINSIAKYSPDPIELLQSAKRKVILTPHPLEFSRISSLPVNEIEGDRVSVARDFAKKTGTVLVLKGHGTVVTDGECINVNTTGTSALAKAGSGDTLAGLLASLLATRLADSVTLASLAVFIHGMAGDRLAKEYSEYGVTPSDLPREMARVIAQLEKND